MHFWRLTTHHAHTRNIEPPFLRFCSNKALHEVDRQTLEFFLCIFSLLLFKKHVRIEIKKWTKNQMIIIHDRILDTLTLTLSLPTDISITNWLFIFGRLSILPMRKRNTGNRKLIMYHQSSGILYLELIFEFEHFPSISLHYICLCLNLLSFCIWWSHSMVMDVRLAKVQWQILIKKNNN